MVPFNVLGLPFLTSVLLLPVSVELPVEFVAAVIMERIDGRDRCSQPKKPNTERNKTLTLVKKAQYNLMTVG